jgi:hypothetical protein
MTQVSVSEYARLRGLNKATVSRNVRKFGLPTEARDGQLFVSLEHLDAARQQAINLLMRRAVNTSIRQPVLQTGDDTAAHPATEAAAPAEPSPPRVSSGLVAEQEIEKRLKNRRLLRLIELEEGRLVPAAMVTEEQQTVARQFRDLLLQGAVDIASRLHAFVARPRTESELRVWVESALRDVLAGAADEIAARRDDDDDTIEPHDGDTDADDLTDSAAEADPNDDGSGTTIRPEIPAP